MADAWNNRYRYTVDGSAIIGGLTAADAGAFSLFTIFPDASRAEDLVFLVISHGPNGNGSIVDISALENVRDCNAGSNDRENCDADNAHYDYTLNFTGGSSRYDDIMTYVKEEAFGL